MKLSRNWLADFVDVSDIDNKAYSDRMTDTGSKVEGFDVLGEDIENVVVAKIKKITPHENSTCRRELSACLYLAYLVRPFGGRQGHLQICHKAIRARCSC